MTNLKDPLESVVSLKFTHTCTHAHAHTDTHTHTIDTDAHYYSFIHYVQHRISQYHLISVLYILRLHHN